MGEAFITRRGIGNAYAVIAVTYPSGSTCTCTNGTRTFPAKGDTGSFLFLIPEDGTWRVSCTDDDHPDGVYQDVDITAKYQAKTVTLAYELILFDGGAKVPWFVESPTPGTSVGSTIEAHGESGPVVDGTGSVCTDDKISIPENTYSHLCIVTSSDRGHFGLASSRSKDGQGAPSFESIVSSSDVSGAPGTYKLDISDISGEFYVTVYMDGNSTNVMSVSKVWLE